MVPNWKCNSGQGEYGKAIHHLKSISLVTCGQKCLVFDGCIGFDYTNTDKFDQCRLYSHNTPRTAPGGDDRTYCTIKTVGEKEFD